MLVPDAKAFWLPEPMALAAWLPEPMDDTLPEPVATLSNAELKLLKKSAGNCIHSVFVNSIYVAQQRSFVRQILVRHMALQVNRCHQTSNSLDNHSYTAGMPSMSLC